MFVSFFFELFFHNRIDVLDYGEDFLDGCVELGLDDEYFLFKYLFELDEKLLVVNEN